MIHALVSIWKSLARAAGWQEWPAVAARTMRAGFANVPKLDESCVILSFRTYLIPPKSGDRKGVWMEVFELTDLNKYGIENTYAWSEQR